MTGLLPPPVFELQYWLEEHQVWKSAGWFATLTAAQDARAGHHPRTADWAHRIVEFVPFAVHEVTSQPRESVGS